MKKWMFIAVIALLATTGCGEDDYTCTCNYGGDPVEFFYKNTQKSDAQSACNTKDAEAKAEDPEFGCTLSGGD